MFCGPVRITSTLRVCWPKMTQNYIIFIDFSNVTLKEKTHFQRTVSDTTGRERQVKYTSKEKGTDPQKPFE